MEEDEEEEERGQEAATSVARTETTGWWTWTGAVRHLVMLRRGSAAAGEGTIILLVRETSLPVGFPR